MVSKYQEALDLVKPNSRLDYDYLEECSDKEEILKAYDTLQELIYLHEAQKHNISELLKLNEQLEKAIDKACDTLTKFMPNALSQTKEQWKEWLFKESEKQ